MTLLLLLLFDHRATAISMEYKFSRPGQKEKKGKRSSRKRMWEGQGLDNKNLAEGEGTLTTLSTATFLLVHVDTPRLGVFAGGLIQNCLS